MCFLMEEGEREKKRVGVDSDRFTIHRQSQCSKEIFRRKIEGDTDVSSS